MIPRTKARLAAGALALGGVMCSTLPAHAALTSPQANAFVVSATALGNFAAVSPIPSSTYPTGGTVTAVGLNVGPIATDATLTATTSGDPSTGDSAASATVESLGVTLPLGLGTLGVTGVNSTCNATPAGATGTGTIAGLTLTTVLGTKTTIAVKTGKNSTVSIPGVATVTFNGQSTDANGVLTVDAAKITLVGGAVGTVTIGQAQCGGAPPVTTNQTPMISAPVAAGAGATAAIGGVVMVRRRNRGKSVFDAS